MSEHESGFFILGFTQEGKKFRPSDWAERIASLFGQFDGSRRLRYNPGVMPMLRAGAYGLFIASSLAQLEPEAFQYVMQFAENYQLQIEHADNSDVTKADGSNMPDAA